MTIHTFATWDSPAEREREKHRNHKPSQSEALQGKESKKRKTERERREQNLFYLVRAGRRNDDRSGRDGKHFLAIKSAMDDFRG